MAINFSQSCLRCCWRSALTRLLFSRHYQQQLFNIVRAFVFFFILLTSIAICAFLERYFFFCYGSYFATGVDITPLKRESIGFYYYIASRAMLMVSRSSGSDRRGISEERLAILSMKYSEMVSLRSEQNQTSLRQSSISLVRFAFVRCFLYVYYCPRMEQMNYLESVLAFQARFEVDIPLYQLLNYKMNWSCGKAWMGEGTMELLNRKGNKFYFFLQTSVGNSGCIMLFWLKYEKHVDGRSLSNLFDFGWHHGAGYILGVLFLRGQEGAIAMMLFLESVCVAVGAGAAGAFHSQKANFSPAGEALGVVLLPFLLEGGECELGGLLEDGMSFEVLFVAGGAESLSGGISEEGGAVGAQCVHGSYTIIAIQQMRSFMVRYFGKHTNNHSLARFLIICRSYASTNFYLVSQQRSDIIIFNIMSKKIKNQSFGESTSYRNVPTPANKIVKSFLKPCLAVAATPPSAEPGKPEVSYEYYLKFSNEFVLNAFLFYLGGGELQGLQIIPDDEVGLESLIGHARAFQKYYQANNKNVEGITNQAIAQAIGKLEKKFLFLKNVTENYNDSQIKENYSKVMLIVVKLRDNIVFGALERTPPQKPKVVVVNEDDDLVKQDQKPIANCWGYTALTVLVVLLLIGLIRIFSFEWSRSLNPLNWFNILR